MIRIIEVKIAPQRVKQNSNFLIQVRVDKDKKYLEKLSFKLKSKLGGGIANGVKRKL